MAEQDPAGDDPAARALAADALAADGPAEGALAADGPVAVADDRGVGVDLLRSRKTTVRNKVSRFKA
jgi:hypothetical protein